MRDTLPAGDDGKRGFSPSRAEQTTAEPALQGSLRRHALGEAAEVADFAISQDGDVVGEELEQKNKVDLHKPLRAGWSSDRLKKLIREAVHEKPWGHGLAENQVSPNLTMSEIGGGE